MILFNMDLKQATVTIPYEEFAKHQEQVKEIDEARELKRRMDRGELFGKDVVNELLRKLQALGEYGYERGRAGTTSDILESYDAYLFFRNRGFDTEISSPHHTNRPCIILRSLGNEAKSKGERLGWPKLSKEEENQRLLNNLIELETKPNPTEEDLERIETLHYMLREESEDSDV